MATKEPAATPFQRQQYEDTNRVGEATLERRKTWMAMLGSDMDVYDKLVLIYLMSFGGTTRDIRTVARELGVGHGEVDRSMQRLKGMKLVRRPTNDCGGIDVDNNPDLGKLLEPLVDRTQRGVHLRKPPPKKPMGISPQQARRHAAAQKARELLQKQAEKSAKEDGLRREPSEKAKGKANGEASAFKTE